MLIQPIIDIPQICILHGIDNIVISPGSRNAHITISFARHPKIRTYVIPDERAAAYIALGMAQSLKKPVAIVCTSGTAVLNYYPAIAEAYYQNVPLLVFTADRPAFWIDKNDGQTIRQNEVYANHIKRSYTFPEKFDSENEIIRSRQIIDGAINLSEELPQGPVHVNIPINEPFYPETSEKLIYSENIIINKTAQEQAHFKVLDQELIKSISGKKLAIVAGQYYKNDELIGTLNSIAKQKKIPIFADTISNANIVDQAVIFHDSINFKESPELIPECIISFGRSIISKKLKLALRNNNNLRHIHISENDYPADTYLSLNQVIYISPNQFFKALLNSEIKTDTKYFEKLSEANEIARTKVNTFIDNADFGEFKAVKIVSDHLSDNTVAHLANSMPVRYFNILGVRKNIEVFSNRGTSGIDGCTSTALGHAIQNKRTNVLFTGDMAFFYDRNALWHHHIPSNLKIVIFNNHGGGIFRLIEGPNKQPELEKYFETHQKLTAKNTALDFGIEYFHAASEEQLINVLDSFMKSTRAAILEIETIKEINQKIFDGYKKALS